MGMNTQFYTRTGLLTAYALACGYIEKRHVGEVEITLWQEHQTYHVRAHDFGQHCRVFWDSFATLSEARERFFRRLPTGEASLMDTWPQNNGFPLPSVAMLQADNETFGRYVAARNLYYREWTNMLWGHCPDNCRAWGIDPATADWSLS